ncbi:hypothetical protein ACHAWC_005772 [Mediolabrus comicus]
MIPRSIILLSLVHFGLVYSHEQLLILFMSALIVATHTSYCIITVDHTKILKHCRTLVGEYLMVWKLFHIDFRGVVSTS